MVNEKGSREAGELLGRVRISIFAVGVGVTLSNIALAATMIFIAIFGFTLPESGFPSSEGPWTVLLD